jgi:hypothetical protein
VEKDTDGQGILVGKKGELLILSLNMKKRCVAGG